MRAAWLIAVAVLAAGCSPSASPPPPPVAPTPSAGATTASAAAEMSTPGAFMGIPDDQSGGFLNTPIGLIPSIDRVESVLYEEYLRVKAEGHIDEEMRCGRYQYYAVRGERDIGLANPGPNQPDRMLIWFTRRYKAEIPPGR